MPQIARLPNWSIRIFGTSFRCPKRTLGKPVAGARACTNNDRTARGLWGELNARHEGNNRSFPAGSGGPGDRRQRGRRRRHRCRLAVAERPGLRCGRTADPANVRPALAAARATATAGTTTATTAATAATATRCRRVPQEHPVLVGGVRARGSGLVRQEPAPGRLVHQSPDIAAVRNQQHQTEPRPAGRQLRTSETRVLSQVTRKARCLPIFRTFCRALPSLLESPRPGDKSSALRRRQHKHNGTPVAHDFGYVGYRYVLNRVPRSTRSTWSPPVPAPP
jgi:hypothetical protein